MRQGIPQKNPLKFPVEHVGVFFAARTPLTTVNDRSDPIKKNFVVGQSNELIKENVLYDLHNLYDYVGCVLSSTSRFWVFFEPNSTYGTKQIPIAIEFEGLIFLEFSPNLGVGHVQDLEEMGYKSPDDRDDNWLLTEEQANGADHLFFRFSGAFIRVNSIVAFLREDVRFPF